MPLYPKLFKILPKVVAVCGFVKIADSFGFLENAELEPINNVLTAFLLLVLLALAEMGILRKIETITKMAYETHADDKTLVLRCGRIMSIPTEDLVVGDIFILKGGSVVPADGICVESHGLVCNENSVKTDDPVERKNVLENKQNYLILSGSTVTSGIAKVLCLGIGSNSLKGKSMLRRTPELRIAGTPFEATLKQNEKILNNIWKVLIFVYSVFRVISVKEVYEESSTSLVGTMRDVTAQLLFVFLEILLLYILIIPAHRIKIALLCIFKTATRMKKSGILVRNLLKIETAGRTNLVLTCDTGILTINSMHVTSATIADSEIGPRLMMPPELHQPMTRVPYIDPKRLFIDRINSRSITCFCRALSLVSFKQNEHTDDSQSPFGGIGGSIFVPHDEYSDACISTAKWPEHLIGSALAEFTRWLGYDSKTIKGSYKVVKHCPYDPALRYAASLVFSESEGMELFVVGAGECLIPKLSRYVCFLDGQDDEGDVKPITPNYLKSLNSQLSLHTRRAMLTMIVAYSKVDSQVDLENISVTTIESLIASGVTHIGTVGMSKPLYSGISGAINALKSAGVGLVLLTQDGPGISNSILWKCGDINANGVAIEGEKLHSTSNREFNELIGRVNVVFDCGPTEAQLLIEKIKRSERIVSFTYSGRDNCDESVAMASDVVYALGLSTPSAKSMSDITLQNNSLVNLVKAVMYGRVLVHNIRRYLLYKVHANVSMYLLLFLDKIAYGYSSRVGLEHILIMTLLTNYYSICAITTPNSAKGLLRRHPEGSDTPIISNNHILPQFLSALIEFGCASAIIGVVAGVPHISKNYAGEVGSLTHLSMLYSYVMIMSLLGSVHWTSSPLQDTVRLNLHMTIRNRKYLISTILILLIQYISLVSKSISGFLGLETLTTFQWMATLALCVFLIACRLVLDRALRMAKLMWKNRSKSHPEGYETLCDDDPEEISDTPNDAAEVHAHTSREDARDSMLKIALH